MTIHRKEPIDYSDFEKLELAIGTIKTVQRNEKAKKPAYVLEIDFGALGQKLSSAQLVDNYTPEELVGKQIVAILNFPSKSIAGVKSEVLVLGALSPKQGVVLLSPDQPVEEGTAIG